MLPAEFPSLLPGYLYRPDGDHSRQRRLPQGVVLHCGSYQPDLADASLGMDISYNFAWDVPDDKGPGQYTQLVPMDRRAWHASSAGNHWLGIAMSGPETQDPRDPWELQCLARLLRDIHSATGGYVKYWCRHSDICATKRDPGPGLKSDWVRSETGLIWRRAS